jgi:hypothetical protein
MRWILAGVLSIVVLPAAHPALAACISNKCQDADAIERARELIQDTCGCTRSGQTHSTYKKCVQSTLKLANLTALIPQKQCRKLIKKCESTSICGKLNAVVCCTLKKNDKVKSSIVGSADKCKGSACGALLGYYGTSDACAEDGTCAGPKPKRRLRSLFMGRTPKKGTTKDTNNTKKRQKIPDSAGFSFRVFRVFRGFLKRAETGVPSRGG